MYIHKQHLSPAMNNLFEKLGYWVVNQNLVFINKAQALMYCSVHNTNDIKYCLGPITYGLANWLQEPSESLLDLYKKRALQLREKYDYVVLTYSGGSDSTNVLYSFVDNNIFPDEVISWTLEGPGFDLQNFNANRELYHSSTYVKTNIINKGIPFYTLDFSSQYDKLFDEDWCLTGDSTLRASTNARNMCMYTDRYRKLIEQGKSICIVLGLEKPNVHIDENGNMFCIFQDSGTSQFLHKSAYSNEYDGPDRESFYITPDLPALTIKQSHVLADELKMRYCAGILDFNLTIGDKFDSGKYKLLATEVLYGHCFKQSNSFSIGKAVGIFGLRDEWLWSLPDSDLRKQKVCSGLLQVKENVDSKWFNKSQFHKGFIGCISDRYYLGKNLWK